MPNNRLATIAVAAFLCISVPADSIEAVMERAGTYAEEFQRQLSGLAATESYVQDIVRINVTRKYSPAVTHRHLLSDLLLVRPAGGDRYVEYRDVLAVDGTPVRDQSARLERLLANPTTSTSEQINAIIKESARYNIGNISRTINTPVLSLFFLSSHQQPRFQFVLASKSPHSLPKITSKAGDTSDSTHFTVSSEVWVVQYREIRHPTVVTTPTGADLPLRGRLWIEPDTGRVLMSEITAQDTSVNATVQVSYQSEPILGFLVPIEMREKYESSRDGAIIEGAAHYSNFRPFAFR